MPRYKRLKKVNHKKEKSNKKRAVKDDIDAKKKKEDIKDYEIKKLLWELRGGKLRYGKAAGRVSGSSWIATQNKGEEMKIQRNAMQALAKQQALENANVKDQYDTYRTNVELEKGVGMQNEINSMKEMNKAREYKLQQERKTSASGRELMNEISEEHANVKKQYDLMSETVKKKQDIGKMQKGYEEDKKKLIELSGGDDKLPEVIDEDYVKKLRTAYDDAKRTQKNVTEAVNARKKAIGKFDKEAKRIGIPDDSDFYKTKDLIEKKSMMSKYLADQKEVVEKIEKEWNDVKEGFTNMKKVVEDKEKSIDELRGQFTELYPDDAEYVDGIINDPRYTYTEKMGRIFEIEKRKQVLNMVKKETLYQAAVMVGEQNKRDEERVAELSDSVGRLRDEAINDKRYTAEKENIHKKGSAGFKREVNEIMQLVNPLYDSVNIDPQYRATNKDAVAVLERINKEARKLRDEDDNVE